MNLSIEMLKRLLRYVALLCLLVAGVAAHAATCTLNSLTSSPTMPARVVVAGSPVSGKIIFSMSMYADVTCTWTNAAAGYLAVNTPFGTTASALINVLNVNAVAGASPVATVLSGPCTIKAVSVQTSSSESDMLMSTGQTCRFMSQFQIYLTGTGAAPGGTMSNISPTLAGVTNGMPYWLNYLECVTAASCSSSGSANGFTTTFLSLSSTCTVNSSSLNQSVTLPTLSTAQLGSVGNISGQTPFSLSLACNNAGGSFGVSTLWNFTEGGAQNIILNTGTGTGFGFQINDANNSPALDKVSRATLAAVVNGTNVLNFWLYYYTTGLVSAGTAIGTATFTLTYN